MDESHAAPVGYSSRPTEPDMHGAVVECTYTLWRLTEGLAMETSTEQPIDGVGRDPAQMDSLLDHTDMQLWVLIDDQTFSAVNRACAAFHG